jgi:gluconate 2-dehydrogenase gamma chain
MGKQRVSRRRFLEQSGAGAGAVAGLSVLGTVAPAAVPAQAASAPPPAPPAALAAQAADELVLLFFSRPQARAVEAIASRVWPEIDGVGVRELGVVTYIDGALAGAYTASQPTYVRGLAQLDAYCAVEYGVTFPELDATTQDRLLADLEAGRVASFTNPTGPQFFNLVRAHTMEGILGDPAYGGNRQMLGWRSVGYPGAQTGYGDAYVDRVCDIPPIDMMTELRRRPERWVLGGQP